MKRAPIEWTIIWSDYRKNCIIFWILDVLPSKHRARYKVHLTHWELKISKYFISFRFCSFVRSPAFFRTKRKTVYYPKPKAMSLKSLSFSFRSLNKKFNVLFRCNWKDIVYSSSRNMRTQHRTSSCFDPKLSLNSMECLMVKGRKHFYIHAIDVLRFVESVAWFAWATATKKRLYVLTKGIRKNIIKK